MLCSRGYALVDAVRNGPERHRYQSDRLLCASSSLLCWGHTLETEISGGLCS